MAANATATGLLQHWRLSGQTSCSNVNTHAQPDLEKLPNTLLGCCNRPLHIQDRFQLGPHAEDLDFEHGPDPLGGQPEEGLDRGECLRPGVPELPPHLYL